MLKLWMAFAIACVAIGCSPATPEANAPTTGVASFYPLTPGLYREYRVKKSSEVRAGGSQRKTDKPGAVFEQVMGPSHLPGAMIVRRRVVENNPRFPKPVVVEVDEHVAAHAQGVFTLGVGQPGQPAQSLPTPFPILTEGPAPNDVVTKVRGLDMRVQFSPRVIEPVSVPAGQYPQAIKRMMAGQTSGQIGDLHADSVTVEETAWFAPNVGLVKMVRVLRIVAADVSGTDTMVRELTRVTHVTPPQPR